LDKGGRLIETISNNARIQLIEYHPEFSVICSVGKAPFHGVIDISYAPKEKLLEFESFEKWLFSIANQSMTIEDLCRLCFDSLLAALGDIPLCVTVHGRTTVHCAASATISKD
jgi:NADPH-dependent 7-cyano-7-deazaguanine reductase QueF